MLLAPLLLHHDLLFAPTHIFLKPFQSEPLIFQLQKVYTLLWSFPPPTGTSAPHTHVSHEWT